MVGLEFIFSEKRRHRLLRHLAFWLGCWLYLCLSYYIIQQSWMTPEFNPKYVSPGNFILLKTFLLVLVYSLPCYAFIYNILPALLIRKWMKASVIILPLVCLMYGLGWLMYWKLFPFIDSLFGLDSQNDYPTSFWPAVVLGLIDPLKIIAAAAIIKYAKHWWLTQKEKEKLEQEKLTAELQLLKAQINPGFLFTALDNIYEYSLAASPRAPELLLKLSDLLSYIVYECEASFVPLEKEIEHMQNYISLEKLRLHDRLETGLTISGEMKAKIIAPFILLPFIENSFKESAGNPDQAWVNMDINVTKDLLTMKLANGMKPSDENRKAVTEDALTNVQKRLSLIYPQKYELKISRESEMLIVLLKIWISPEL